MIFLFLNIVASSTFVLTLKWLQVREHNDTVTVGCVNYVAGAVAVLPWFFSNGVGPIDPPAVWTGACMGSCYFVAFFFVIYAIRYVGVSASTVIAVLSIMVPILVGIFLWRERPNSMQVIGIALALLSLLMIGGTKTEVREREKRVWFTPFLLISFFLLAGMSRLSQATFGHVSAREHLPTFLLSAFCIASVPSIACLIYRRKRIPRQEFGMGLFLGASNILQSFFLLKALERLPSYQVFPVVSAGGLMFVTLVATVVFREKLTAKSYTGIATAAIALVLLNWAIDS